MGPGTIGAVGAARSADETIDDPVARVAVDISLAHLDRPFDYAIPAVMSADAVPGARVRVRFAGRLVDGFILERVAASEHRLSPLARVTSPLPVATPATLTLARAVADRYAGSVADVLRAAIPPRHARAEQSVLSSPEFDPTSIADVPSGTASAIAGWADYLGGPALVRRMAAGESVRAVWNAGPAEDWPRRIAELAVEQVQRGTGLLVVLPDARDVSRVDAALTETLTTQVGQTLHETLTADAGPQRRYAAFCRLLTGRRRVAVGTRAACFAPVPEGSALVIWEDGEETYAEPHSPGWHAREVLALRSHLFGVPLMAGGFGRSVAAQSWIASGWAGPVVMDRDVIRERAPRVQARPTDIDGAPARLPSAAMEVARSGLTTGPVLVQVARSGYLPGMACARCRTPARCGACGGPLAITRSGAIPTCRWCSSTSPGWRCPHCHASELRAMARGAVRTAEELGRAFPNTLVTASGGEHILDMVSGDPQIVIATPGAEPVAEGGYAAVLLLDAHITLARASLSAGEETVRRWLTAAALARSAAPLVVTAEPSIPAVQALMRWDPGWFAARDLAEREMLRLPPVMRSAMATGTYEALEQVRQVVPAQTIVHGPFPVDDDRRLEPPRARLLLLADREQGSSLVRALREVLAVRAARREAAGLEIRIDPADWGGENSHF